MLRKFHQIIFAIAIIYCCYFIYDNSQIFFNALGQTNFGLFVLSMIVVKISLSLNLFFIARFYSNLNFIKSLQIYSFSDLTKYSIIGAFSHISKLSILKGLTKSYKKIFFVENLFLIVSYLIIFLTFY